MKSISRRMPRVRRGFTPIDLLVVIAIIAILASLLLPALANAKMNLLHYATDLRAVDCPSLAHWMTKGGSMAGRTSSV